MSWATVAKVGAVAAWKGGKWGYGKYKQSRCVKEILGDASRLTPDEERILRCAAKKLCGGKADNMKEAKRACRR